MYVYEFFGVLSVIGILFVIGISMLKSKRRYGENPSKLFTKRKQ